ncbi:MAG: hypothetical protein KF716_08880 [Anaerolineae bacterium]|nr:hypothetical protein [Anaerolineae bacterium]
MIEFDKRHQLTTPSGIISDAGIVAIAQLIDAENPLTSEAWKALNPTYTANYIPRLPADWTWEWIVKKGVYAGTLPKRVARYFFKTYGLKSPPAFLERLGNIARQHTSEGETFTFDFTQALTWNAGDFGDAGSCYWGGHAGAREMLMDDGAFAIRFYKADGKGFARAWVVDRMKSHNFYVLFNGYGLSSTPTLTAARVLSLHLGLTYKRVSLSNYGRTSATLYINSDLGYLIGAIEHLDRYSNFDLEIGEPDGYLCEHCGREINEDEGYTTPDGDMYCENCYDDYYRTCDECGEVYYYENVTYIESVDRDVCEECRDEHYSSCDRCEQDYPNDALIEVEDGDNVRYYCQHCKNELDAEQQPTQPE